MSFTLQRHIINSKSELFDVIQQVREHRLQVMRTAGRLVCEMYRGQGRDTWKLEPNIIRNLKDETKIKSIEKALITEFHEELIRAGLSNHIQTAFLNGKYHSDWLLVQQAQHYGIPTRFMDWTINWEVALFFAVSNSSDDTYDGQFWIYIVQPEQLEIDDSGATYYDSDPFEFSESIFLNASGFLSDEYLSKIAMRRVARQNGRFQIQPYTLLNTPLEENPIHQPYLHKIVIPKEVKENLRNELAEINFTNENLYILIEPKIEEIKDKLRIKFNV